MEVLVRNAEGNVSPKDREYAAKKLGRLDRYFHSAQSVEMVHREEGNGHRIEITIFADGFTIRGKETDESLQAAIDRVHDKLETRLRKLKGRIVKAHRRRGGAVPKGFDEPHHEDVEEHHVEIKERKSFLLKPMSIDEAGLQMEMIDHNFFVFRSEETGTVAILFKRKSGGYGLIEPEM